MTQTEPRRWRVLVRVLLFFLSCAVLLAVASPLARKVPALTEELFVGIFATLGTFVLTVLFLRSEGLHLKDAGAAPSKNWATRLILGFVLGLLLVVAHSSTVGALGHVKWVRTTGTGLNRTMLMFLSYLALSCREELGFHGYPLRRLKTCFGLWGSQLIVAVVFVSEHMAGGWPWTRALFGAGIGCLLFGMAAITTEGLAVPIGLHAGWNFGDWLRGNKGSDGYWKSVVEERFQEHAEIEGMIIYVIIMVLATMAFWWLHRRGMRKDHHAG